MPFLAAEPCVGHSGASTNPADVCCAGYTKWNYDANTGIPYQGFMCWTASCAGEGQFAPPLSTSGAGCCTGLVPINGKCSRPVSTTPPLNCIGVGMVPPAGQACCSGLVRDSLGICNAPGNIPGASGGEWIAGIPNDYIMYGGLALMALLMLGGKK